MALTAIAPTTINGAARYERLLRVANIIAACNDCDSATDRLVRELHDIVHFDYLRVVSLKTQRAFAA